MYTHKIIIITIFFIIILSSVTAAKAHVIDIVDHQWDEGQRFWWPRRQRRSGRGSRHSIGQHTFRLSPLHRRTYRVGVQGNYLCSTCNLLIILAYRYYNIMLTIAPSGQQVPIERRARVQKFDYVIFATSQFSCR